MEIDIYNSEDKVFQVDSEIVKNAYRNLDNYLIVEDDTNIEANEKICALYFSGHSIYFPNNEQVFNNQIIKKNRFEWYGKRFKAASKHIYLRDIHKQWYLTGINARINSPEKLLDFLKEQTDGYQIVCIGSSAGGYAALLYGALLNAKVVFAFSPRLECHSLERRSNPSINPLYFRLKNTERVKYMDIIPFLKESSNRIYCFYPSKSKLDQIQLSHLNSNYSSELSNLKVIIFNTAKHGVPFPKVALEPILYNCWRNLDNLAAKTQNPILYSIKQVGLLKTIKGMYVQLKNHYFK